MTHTYALIKLASQTHSHTHLHTYIHSAHTYTHYTHTYIYNSHTNVSTHKAMLKHYDTAAPAMADRLRTHTRCLRDGNGDGGWRTEADPSFLKTYTKTFPQEKSPPALNSLRSRSLMCAIELREAMASAWGEGLAVPVDCLFALERLGCPYRNVRGVDISAHTEPIDSLWFVGCIIVYWCGLLGVLKIFIDLCSYEK